MARYIIQRRRRMKFLTIILMMITLSCNKTKEVVNETVNAAKDSVEAVVDKGLEAAQTNNESGHEVVAGPLKPITLTQESKIEFKVLKFAKLAEIEGKFTKFQGVAKYDGKHLSSVQAAIYANSINTADEKRDGHLKSEEWFAVAKHPIISFTTSSAVELGKSFDLPGEIEIKGVKLPITLQGTLVSRDFDNLVVKATGVINRTKFGLNWNKPLDEEVTLMGKIGKIAVDEDVTLSLTIVAKADK